MVSLAKEMKIRMIWAQDLNGVIGKGNRLLWNNSKDLKLFKSVTLDQQGENVLLMGSKTYFSLPKALPDRTSLVLTSTKDKLPSFTRGKTTVKPIENIDEAIQYCIDNNIETLTVIGGGTLYKTMINHPLVKELHISVLDLLCLDEGDDIVYAPDLKINWVSLMSGVVKGSEALIKMHGNSNPNWTLSHYNFIKYEEETNESNFIYFIFKRT